MYVQQGILKPRVLLSQINEIWLNCVKFWTSNCQLEELNIGCMQYFFVYPEAIAVIYNYVTARLAQWQVVVFGNLNIWDETLNYFTKCTCISINSERCLLHFDNLGFKFMFKIFYVACSFFEK